MANQVLCSVISIVVIFNFNFICAQFIFAHVKCSVKFLNFINLYLLQIKNVIYIILLMRSLPQISFNGCYSIFCSKACSAKAL